MSDKPRSWAQMPLSAPRWAWLVYVAVTALLMWAGTASNAAIAVGLEAILSFQFWTFAAYRALYTRARAEARPTTTTGESQ